MTSLPLGMSVTVEANVAYALPASASQVSYQGAGALTITASNDNSTWSSLDTTTAGQLKSIFTAALFIKFSGVAIVVAKYAPVTTISTGSGGGASSNLTASSITSSSGSFIINATYYSPEIDDGNSSATKSIDFAIGNEHLVTMTASCTFTFSGGVDGGRYVLLIKTGAGGFTPTFPATVKWSSATTPTCTTTANKYDLVTLYYTTAGIYLGTTSLGHS